MTHIKDYQEVRIPSTTKNLLGHTWYSTRSRFWSGRALGDKRLVGYFDDREAAVKAVAERYAEIAGEELDYSLMRRSPGRGGVCEYSSTHRPLRP